MTDRQLVEDLLSALEYHTEQTRPIEFSRVAIEAAREYLRKPAQRTWVGLTPDDFRQLEKETTVNGYNGDYCPTWDLIEAVEEKLKEKNT